MMEDTYLLINTHAYPHTRKENNWLQVKEHEGGGGIFDNNAHLTSVRVSTHDIVPQTYRWKQFGD